MYGEGGVQRGTSNQKVAYCLNMPIWLPISIVKACSIRKSAVKTADKPLAPFSFRAGRCRLNLHRRNRGNCPVHLG